VAVRLLSDHEDPLLLLNAVTLELSAIAIKLFTILIRVVVGVTVLHFVTYLKYVIEIKI